MNNNDDSNAALLEPREKPDARMMLAEIRDALNEAQNTGLFDRLRMAHQTRRCWWENQQSDGTVPAQADKTYLPWKGAIAHRVPLAHLIVSELTMLQMTVLNRGDVEVKPRQSAEDLDKAGIWTLVFNYYLECQMPAALLTLKEHLRKNLRLLFDAKNELGYAMTSIRWRKRRAQVERKLTVEDLLKAAQQQEMERVLSELPEGTQLAPDQEEGIVEAARLLVETALSNPDDTPLVDLVRRVDEDVVEAEARKAGRALRSANETTYFSVEDAGGIPEVTTLIPWLNCGHTLDLSEDGKGSAFFVREVYTLATLRARAEEEEWPAAFLAAVEAGPNTSLFQTSQNWDDGKWIMNGTSMLMELGKAAGDMKYFEIIRRVGKAVSKTGLETIYETVLFHGCEEHVGRHIALSKESHELMFVTHAFEPTLHAWLSRGVPEILLTLQKGLKKLYDAETCRAELGSVPPLQVNSDNSHVRPMPGMVMTNKQRDNMFLRTPESDGGAYRLRQELKQWADELFYRGQGVDPELKRAFREDLAAEALCTLSQVYRGMWKLIQRHTDMVRASRVAGQPVNLKADKQDLQGDADVSIAFNIGVLSDEMASKFLDFGTKVMTSDRSGAMDAFEFVRTAWQMFDPSAARRLIRQREATTGAEIKEAQMLIANMTAGQPVQVPDNINYELWEQVLLDWWGNPETQQMVAARPMLQQQVQEVWRAVQFQREQKTTNVQWGRTGQAPIPPWQRAQQEVLAS